jgi:hypothetical protein
MTSQTVVAMGSAIFANLTRLIAQTEACRRRRRRSWLQEGQGEAAATGPSPKGGAAQKAHRRARRALLHVLRTSPRRRPAIAGGIDRRPAVLGSVATVQYERCAGGAGPRYRRGSTAAIALRATRAPVARWGADNDAAAAPPSTNCSQRVRALPLGTHPELNRRGGRDLLRLMNLARRVESVAEDLTVPERILLFCADAGADWRKASGVTSGPPRARSPPTP